tara:strand:- start:377 stop:1087 length:711 start_codon:yes stop_codon:yes gene_type:complete
MHSLYLLSLKDSVLNNDQIKTNFNISLSDSFIIIIFSLIGGIFIRYLYIKYSNSFSSKVSYGNSLLMVTLSVAALIAVVKSSLALSLGLVGALSVVRFRTAVKEPFTLSFVLLAVCLGISIGASQYLFAFLVAMGGSLAAIISNISLTKKLNKKETNDIDRLNIVGKSEKSVIEALDLISEMCKTYQLKTITSSSNSQCVATVGIHIDSNVELKDLLYKLNSSSDIVGVTFYNSPS